jgi:sec-independent protein translocase protein TatC
MKVVFNIHLYELKYRTLYIIISYIVCFFICLIFKVELFFLISKYFLQFNSGFIFTKLTEPFFFYLKLILFCSFYWIFSVLLYFYGFFFFKSFYNYQIKFFLFLFFLFYLIIGFYFYFFFKFYIPFILNFFFLFERVDINSLLMISFEAKLNDFLTFFFVFTFILLFITHFPLFLMLYTSKFLNINNIKIRKYIYMIMFILFICIAPPEIFSQILILPLFFFFIEFLFYFIFLIYILWK